MNVYMYVSYSFTQCFFDFLTVFFGVRWCGSAAGEDHREIGPSRRRRRCTAIQGPEPAQSNLRNSIPRNSYSFSFYRIFIVHFASYSYSSVDTAAASSFLFIIIFSFFIFHPISSCYLFFALSLFLFACHFTHLLLSYAH